MAGKRIDIMDLRQLITLKQKKLSNRKVASLLGISRNTVNAYVQHFSALSLGYEELLTLSETDLQELFPKDSELENTRYAQLSKQFTYFAQELKKPGCTLEVLWQAYFTAHPEGYKYSQFAHHFSQWKGKQKAYSGKLTHKAGENLYIDFTGKLLEIVDRKTGEVRSVQVFVGILPCSQYTFVMAVETQGKEDLIKAVRHCLEYFGGSPAAIVSDNLKAAVHRSSKYAPEINKTFKDFALHYGCVVNPTRAYAPQDKALVEGAVKLVYQRIFYPLSKSTFFSLHDLNKAIQEQLEAYNSYEFSHGHSSRGKDFHDLEKEHLNPLPPAAYEIRQFKRAKVQKMGYIYLSEDKHYYSVPYQYIGKYTEVQYTDRVVEVYYNRERIALHQRNPAPGKYSTQREHVASTHRHYTEWNLEFFQQQATKIGPHTEAYITQLILQYSYPELGYKQAQGILRALTSQYTRERVEKACERGLEHERANYRIIENILKAGLDKDAPVEQQTTSHIPEHQNIRGASSYQ